MSDEQHKAALKDAVPANFRSVLFSGSDEIENGVNSNIQYERFKLLSRCTVIHDIIALLGSIMYYEWVTNEVAIEYQEVLLFLILINVIILVCCITLRNIVYFLFLKERKLINNSYSYILSGRSFYTLLNIC